jgi:hypothetical protein
MLLITTGGLALTEAVLFEHGIVIQVAHTCSLALKESRQSRLKSGEQVPGQQGAEQQAELIQVATGGVLELIHG